MKKLNLQQFAGSLTVTVYKDAHMTTASASPSSSLAKDDSVALTLTPASGYEVNDVEVVSGGVTIDYDPDDGYSFTMGESNVVLNVTSKKNNLYKITENTWVWVNGSGTELKRNMKYVRHNNGAIVDVESSGTAVTVNADVVAKLIEAGVLIKI